MIKGFNHLTKTFIYHLLLPVDMESKLLTKMCPICGKEIKSLYQKQLEYNYNSHYIFCKDKGCPDKIIKKAESICKL